MAAAVSIEWIIGIARQHPDGGSYREHAPWDTVATVVISGTSADIRACRGELTKHTISLLKDELRKVGIRTFTWDRYKPTRKQVEGTVDPSSSTNPSSSG